MNTIAITINAHTVTATFDVQDFRADKSSLIGIQVEALLTIDGQSGYSVLYQHEGDGLMEVADSDAGNDEAHERVADALGVGRSDGDFCFDDFADALAAIRKGAQDAVDALLDGEVVNDDEVAEADMVTGFTLDFGCWFGGEGFECDGNGYISLFNAEDNWRQHRVYRLDAQLIEQLEEIKDETDCNDANRTRRVLELFGDETACI